MCINQYWCNETDKLYLSQYCISPASLSARESMVKMSTSMNYESFLQLLGPCVLKSMTFQTWAICWENGIFVTNALTNVNECPQVVSFHRTFAVLWMLFSLFFKMKLKEKGHTYFDSRWVEDCRETAAVRKMALQPSAVTSPPNVWLNLCTCVWKLHTERLRGVDLKPKSVPANVGLSA